MERGGAFLKARNDNRNLSTHLARPSFSSSNIVLFSICRLHISFSNVESSSSSYHRIIYHHAFSRRFFNDFLWC